MLRPVSSSRICRSISAGVPCRKSWLEHPGRPALRRDRDARAGPRQAAAAVDRQGERREPRQHPDPFGHELVERDRVPERAAGRVRGRGQEADVRRVAAVHERVRHAAEHGEVGAVLLEEFQVRRGGVVAARVRRGRTAGAARRGCCRCRTSAAAPGRRPTARTGHSSIPGTAAPSPRPSRGGSAAERSAAASTRREPWILSRFAGSSPVFPTCSGRGRSARSHGRCCARRTGWPSPRRGFSRSPPGRKTAPARRWRRSSTAGPGSARSAVPP